jgi:hypothetical protein
MVPPSLLAAVLALQWAVVAPPQVVPVKALVQV